MNKPILIFAILVSASAIAIAAHHETHGEAAPKYATPEVPAAVRNALKGAVVDFVNSLDAKQRKAVVVELNDPHREDWHFFPDTQHPRTGLKLMYLEGEQLAAIHRILRTALSSQGYFKVMSTLRLDTIHHDNKVRDGVKGNVEDYGQKQYWATVYGNPAKDDIWQFGLEGHHLSLNFTVTPKGVAVTPMAFGTNPAEVKGPNIEAGLRGLAFEEDWGYQLMEALTAKQRKQAIFSEKTPKNLLALPSKLDLSKAPKGLAVAEMNENQKRILKRLINEYVNNLDSQLAWRYMKQINDVGMDKLSFAWAGPMARGEGKYFILNGPTFVAEFDNPNGNATHVHTIWRNPGSDFGRDWLMEHYASDDHKAE